MNVSFIHPELNIKKERGQIFRITHASDIKLEKVNKDTVKIIYGGPERRVSTKVENMYGIEFIYVNTWKIKKKKN
ncbi:MAG: hypothetical protein HND52_10005 [Ignavibacteriae bacterium]|nr:hypothetical protein [Ignavibacteriota bacterium]NOG98281.1 hypothetical protein [Ignavibacteriota bacterium]